MAILIRGRMSVRDAAARSQFRLISGSGELCDRPGLPVARGATGAGAHRRAGGGLGQFPCRVNSQLPESFKLTGSF